MGKGFRISLTRSNSMERLLPANSSKLSNAANKNGKYCHKKREYLTEEDRRFYEMTAKEAIVIRNARKCYTKNVAVLDNLNMVVSRGCIYGLLGASGCGKSTLLSCVVGVRRLDSGDIWVLGGKPGSKGSGIPGPRVGYMPQEISLVNEFTTANAMYYFGRISGVEDDVIEERLAFLTKLLHLPPRNTQVKHMSGGQQRRVSFAAAMIHKPELLILDEPTVGLDPVLRADIWEHLITITKEEDTAVVITTHYIEEAKQADKVGMMRCGQLLTESTPGQIMSQFQCPTLEEAFLTLSQRQADNQERGITEVVSNEVTSHNPTEVNSSTVSLHNGHYSSTDNIISSEKQQIRDNEDMGKVVTAKWKKFKALLTKNALQLVKHPGGVTFAMIFPVLQTFLFFNAIGEDPKNLHMAVVNKEAGNCNYSNIWGEVNYYEDTEDCDFVDLSCRYLHGFDDSIIIKDYYPDQNSAYEAVRNGKAVGAMFFSSNFSEALRNRRDNARYLTDEELDDSAVQISLDMGNRQIGLNVQKRLFDRFFEIQDSIMQECHIDPRFGEMPLRFEEPLLGSVDQKYSNFMAPGFLLTVIFFLATSLTSAIIISDRVEGVWDRTLVAGVTVQQILAAHVTVQFALTCLQVTLVLCVALLGFSLPCRGPLLGVIVLVLMIGFCGMCYGFFISVMVSTHTVANYVSTGSFYPLILLSGCIWPMEGMPVFLQWISRILPTTLPSLSMRAMLEKGYSIDEFEVYIGFLIIAAWTVALMISCILALRSKTAG
ncbi:ABC transporter G family member 20-like isoform X1 [Diprion similis]|uniref:ABC transporter G family member 20-like isoform X1 n=2 Tax=Diprion similis TaxID=362088 RepID=UPI001EF831A0|nr:ABC transporter G family member 20-like isoform X1 [Diprion similis]XP_046742303.1 ABC transporter G family member 20-like isoform X1 [Diprion similis]